MQSIAAPIVQRNWWIMALRGLFAVIFGLIALVAPRIALLAFIYVFAAYAEATRQAQETIRQPWQKPLEKQ